MNKFIFVACDSSNINHIKKILNLTKNLKIKIIPKFGLQFFYSKNGRKFLENLNRDFWLDLKINDIPQTALSAIDSIKDLKRCKYITAHSSGGVEMLKAIKKKSKKINKNLKILGVTILTSLDNKQTKKYYNQENIEALVKKFAKQAKKNKLDGIVCSPNEIKYIRKEVGKKFLIVTPGIRLNKFDIKKDDQQRILDPLSAIEQGANLLVIGRPILNSKDPLKKLMEINKSLN